MALISNITILCFVFCLQEEERNIRDEHAAYQKTQAQIQKDKHRELSAAMERAKKHVLEVFKEKFGKVKNKEVRCFKVLFVYSLSY